MIEGMRKKKIKGLKSIINRALFVCAGLLVLLIPVQIHAYTLIDDGNLTFGTQKHIIKDSDDHYWVFTASSNAFAYYYSEDGSNWTYKGSVFPAGSLASKFGSAWYDESQNMVFVAASESARSQYILVRAGIPQADGSQIAFGDEVQIDCGDDSNTNSVVENTAVDICYVEDAQRPIVVVGKNEYRDGNSTKYVSIGRGTHVGTAISNDGEGEWQRSSYPDALIAPVVVPEYYGYRGVDEPNAYVFFKADGSEQVRFRINDAISPSGDNEEVWGNAPSAIQRYGTYAVAEPQSEGVEPKIHMVGVSGSDPYYLYYSTRTTGSTWSPDTACITVNPYENVMDPQIAWVKTGNTYQLFTVCISSWDAILLYRYYAGTWTQEVFLEPGDGGSIPWKYPSIHKYGESPMPLGLVFEGNNQVYFDQIITSTQSAPTLTNATPSIGGEDSWYVDISLTGTGFQNWGDLTTKFFIDSEDDEAVETDIKIISTTWVSDTSAIAHIEIGTECTGGPYDIQIINPDLQKSSYPDDCLIDTFTVPTPVLTGATPSTGGLDSEFVDVTITGTGFQAWGLTTYILIDGGAPEADDIKIISTTYNSSSEVIAHVEILDNCTGGPYDLRIQNPDSQYAVWPGDCIVNTFTVVAPQISTMNYLSRGITWAGDIEIHATDNYFQLWGTSHPDINIWKGAYYITVTSTTRKSYSQVNASVVISSNAPGGAYNVQLINNDGQSSNVLTSSFVVTTPLSNITYPVTVEFSSNVAIINGTAGLNPLSPASTGVAEIQITLVDDPAPGTDDGKNYNGAGWTSSDQWLSVTPLDASSQTWKYIGWKTVDQEDKHSYLIKVRGKSGDGGLGNYAGSEKTLVMDKSAPEVFFTAPQSGVSVGASFTAIEGTAIDDAASGLDKVFVRIADMNWSEGEGDDYTWTGSSWSDQGHLDNWVEPDDNASYTDPGDDVLKTFSILDGESGWPTLTNNTKYRIQVKAQDDLLQMSTPNPDYERVFIYDTTRPTATLNSPVLGPDTANATWMNSLNTISGTILDNVVDEDIGDRNIYLKITEQGPTVLWNWHKEIITPDVADAPWFVDVSTTDWQNDTWYKIEMYAEDAAGNNHGGKLTPVASGYIQIDNNDPGSMVKYPPYNATPRAYGSGSLTTISGSAFDADAGIDYIEYRIGCAGADCWDNDPDVRDWMDPYLYPDEEIWNVAGTTTTTPYDIWIATGIDFTGAARNGEEYDLNVRAYDFAGNVLQWSTTVYFKYDTSPPQAGVAFPIEGATYHTKTGFTVISGTAVDYPLKPDNAGIPSKTAVKIKIQRTSDNNYFDGSEWDVAVASNSADSLVGSNWTFDFVEDAFFETTSSDTFKIWVWAFDDAKYPNTSYINTGDSTTLKRTFYFETDKPSSTITSPAVEWDNSGSHFNKSNNTLITISGTAGDEPAGTAAGIWKVLIELVNLGADGIDGDSGGPGDEDVWYSGSQFNSYSIVMSTDLLPSGLPWKLNLGSASKYPNTAGRLYRVRT
ncbi:MAG: hypothetical protein ABII23_07445, partial [bacterium]